MQLIGIQFQIYQAEELMYVVADLYSKPPGQAVFTNGQVRWKWITYNINIRANGTVYAYIVCG